MPGRVTVFEGDSRDMSGIPLESINLVVTSPPYPMVERWDGLFRRLGALTFDEMHGLLGGVWEACHRVLVPGGILAVNVGDALRTKDGAFRLWPNQARVTVECERLGYRTLPYILWKKPTNRPNAFLGSGFLPPNAYVTLDCEFILLFRKGDPRTFPVRDRGRLESRYSRPERDVWFSQVWDDIRGTRQGPEGHRTGAFPSAIPGRLIRMFSVVGDTVLDPFAGTGTTLWVAAQLERNAIGMEVEPRLARLLKAKAEAAGLRGPARAGSGAGAEPTHRLPDETPPR